MSTFSSRFKNDEFIRDFVADIEKSIQNDEFKEIYDKTLEVRKAVYEQMLLFFKYVGGLITKKLNAAPREIRSDLDDAWIPLSRGMRRRKAKERRKHINDADLPNNFYFYTGKLKGALGRSVFFPEDWNKYLNLRLNLESEKGATTSVGLHQKDSVIQYRIRMFLKNNTNVSFRFTLKPILSTKDWIELLQHVDDTDAVNKFFGGSGKMNMPNESSRSLLRPALNHYLRKEVVKSANGVL